MLDCSFHWCTGAGVRIKVLKMSEKCESSNMIEVSVSDTGKSILLYIKWWPWKKVVGFILKIFAFIWNHLWSFWLDGLGFLLPEIFTAKFDKLSEKCEKLELCFDSLHLSNLFLLSIHGLVPGTVLNRTIKASLVSTSLHYKQLCGLTGKAWVSWLTALACSSW